MHHISKPADGDLIRHWGPTAMKSYCDYMKRVTAIHKSTVQRLLDSEETDLLEIAELFEDTANLYQDISEEVRAKVISLSAAADNRAAQQSTSGSPTSTGPEEDTQG